MPDADVTCKDCIKCDDNAITSFPLGLTESPSESIYDSVDEPLTMNFQWATRSISPRFITGGSIDEGNGSGATNVSTLMFNGIKYSIHSVQVATATHEKWVLPVTLQSQNQEDMIITFSSFNDITKYTYIILVIPIIRNGKASTDPNYITGLSIPESRGSFSISSCLPTNKKAQFAYYSTCLNGYTGHKNPENIYVFIAIEGIPVSSQLMDSLSKNITTVSLPFMSRLPATQTLLATATTDFSKYVLTTRHLLDYAGMSRIYKDCTINERTDNINEYQCVPLNPDTDIVDGQIKVDLESGQLLSKVLEERDAVRAMSAPTTLTRAGKNRVETYLGSALGILCAILIFSILLYLIFTYAKSSKSPADAVAAAATVSTNTWVNQLPIYGIMAVVAGLVGFTAGAMIK